MFLDDRKRSILRAIIDDYIDTAEPIGSRTIARKCDLGLSPATIRNEMADLEEMGYLAQPHTSAGRVPSDKGYRMYVDHLMRQRSLTREETDSICSAMENKISEMNQLIKQASQVMSKITNYTSMAITSQSKTSMLKAIQVVPIEPGKALVIVVTNAGTVKNCMVRLYENAPPEMLIRVSNILNEKLSGMTIEQISLPVITEIEREIGTKKEVLMPILAGVEECINHVDNMEVFLDGTTNILNYPEFNNVMKARDFLSKLDEKAVLYKLLSCHLDDIGVFVQIGAENQMEEIKGCSLITATYSCGGIVLGSLGVIGPTRMDYAKVISSLSYIREKINVDISKIIGNDREVKGEK